MIPVISKIFNIYYHNIMQKGTGQTLIWDTVNFNRGRSQIEFYYVPELAFSDKWCMIEDIMIFSQKGGCLWTLL